MATLRTRLARIEDRLRASWETRESMPHPARREYTDEEVVEIALILFAYVYEGDTEAYAQNLIKDHGFDFEKATEVSEMLDALLDEWRAVAPDPTRPV
jgi:hypothetical protein